MTKQKLRTTEFGSLPTHTGLIEGMQINLLGGFQLLQGEEALGSESFHLRKACDLVKLLALAPRHRLPRDQVMEWLWPDGDPKTSVNSLSQALRFARQVLQAFQPAVYINNAEGFLELVSEEAVWVDVEAFEAAAARAHHSQDPSLYQAALSLYTGELLPEDRYEEWVVKRSEALHETYLDLLIDLARLYEGRGDLQLAISAYQQTIANDPLREEAYVGLMRTLTCSGQRTQALRQYKLLLDTLIKELGVEPEPTTKKLFQQIQDGSYPPESQIKLDGFPTQINETARNNLPVYLTRFIGRENEIAQVKELLVEHRLLTLTGPGGTGKTRLALQTVREVLERFSDGVWLVDLAPLSDADLVVQVVGRVLGMRLETVSQALTLLEEYLEKKELLIILDNCEHLIAACAGLADALLHSCLNLHVLATSREALGIEGEAIYPVPPLTTPGTGELPSMEELKQYEAVQLFNERAGNGSPGFTLTQENAAAVALISQRLDGIPLALELAAARVKLLQVEEIARRLDDRFRLLIGGSRAALPRYQTLRASIDWSYDLLSPEERSLLQRLSVFAGGWTLEAAEFIGCREGYKDCSVLDSLGQLVNKSLVYVDVEAGSETRFRMLETIRQYAHEKLVEAGDTVQSRDRHLSYYLELAERMESQIIGPDQASILARLETELDNLRLALSWVLEGKGRPGWGPEPGLRLAAALFRFWNSRGRNAEGLSWLEALLAAQSEQYNDQPVASERIETWAQALWCAGWLSASFGMSAQATEMLKKSRALFEQLGMEGRRGLAQVLQRLGDLAVYHGGDAKEAKRLFEESLILYREVQDWIGVSETINAFGYLALFIREYAQAKAYFEENLHIAKEIGDKASYSFVVYELGMVAFYQGDTARARVLLDESLALCAETNDVDTLYTVLMMKGILDWNEGNFELAARSFDEMLLISRQQENVVGIYWANVCSGKLALSQSDFQQAGERFEASLTLHRKHNYTRYFAWSLRDLGDLAVAEGSLDKAVTRYEEARTIIHDLDKTIEAFALFGLGKVAYAQGNLQAARDLFYKAYEFYAPIYHFWSLEEIIEAVAFVEMSEQRMERAAHLLGASEKWLQYTQRLRSPRERQERESAIAVVRTALGEVHFSAAFEAGQSMTLEQAIQEHLDHIKWVDPS